MESLLDKISSYNILNNIIPGAVFVYFWSALDIGTFPSDNIVESVILWPDCQQSSFASHRVVFQKGESYFICAKIRIY